MFDIFYKEFIVKGGYLTTLSGLLVTIEIAVFGLLIGIIIGTLISIVKVIPLNNILMIVLKKICDIYVGLFRGTPMIVQLLIGFFVLLPKIGLSSNGVVVSIIMFGFNSGAYVSEIMRAGIQSVENGQFEAGRALGLSFGKTMTKIVIPQSIKNILPTLGNEFIALIKETSVVYIIGVVDITTALKSIGDATYEYIIPYLVLAVIYLVLVLIIAFFVKKIERRLSVNEKRHRDQH